MKKSFKEIVESGEVVLVDFSADWCGPCQMLGPILKEVKASVGDAVKIVKIDVDKNKELAEKYQVMGVPTLILFRNGKQVWRQSGLLQKEQLIDILQSQAK